MPSIEIDFEVFKALTNKRETEAVSYNDVIRTLLKLDNIETIIPSSNMSTKHNNKDWIYKGVTFPDGTKFRAHYKGEVHYAKVDNGCLVINGKSVTSPSDAAKIVTNTNVNGWTFWECRLPDATGWRLLTSLRPVRS